MPTIGGMFQGQWQDDFGAIASRAAEQLANTRITSQNERERTAQDLATRPKPTRAVTIVENPDGTVTHTTTVKNAPPRDPQQQVDEAGNAPMAQFAHQTLTQAAQAEPQQPETPYGSFAKRQLALGAKIGGAQQDDIENTLGEIDKSLATREGRVALAKSELGIEDPHDIPGEFVRNGPFDFRKEVHDYEKIIADPKRLKSAILAKKFNEADKVGAAMRPFNADLNTMETQQRQRDMEARQNVAETRRQGTEARREEETFIGDFTRGDHNYGFMDDKGASTLIDAEKQRYKARFGADKEMPGWMETMMRSRIMDDRAKNASDQSKTQFQHDNQDRNYDRLMETLGIQTANTQSMIAARDRKQNTQTISRRDAIETPVDELLTYVGDDGYDQKSVERALKTKENVLRTEKNKLTAAIAIASPTVNVMAKNEPWKKSEIAAHIAKIKANQKRIAEIDADLGMLQSKGAAPATGRVLTKDEALQKLKGQ
jgi:hypothetical protein